MIFAFDTETALIAPGRTAPPLTCITACLAPSSTIQSIGSVSMMVPFGYSPQSSAPLGIVDALEFATIVGHNVAFDLAVLCSEWPDLTPMVDLAYAEDRVTDTKIRQQLLDIAAGCYRGRMGDGNQWIKYDYTLEAVARRTAGMRIKKDGFRLHYETFRNVPEIGWIHRAKALQAELRPELEALRAQAAEEGRHFKGPAKERLTDLEGLCAADPAEVLTYPREDALATLRVWEAQENHAQYLDDQFRKARTHWALHRASAWGLRTDPAKVEKLRQQTEEDLTEILTGLQSAGLVRGDGSRDTKKAAARMLEVCGEANVRRTEKGGVSLDSDACKASGDPLLIDYASATSLRAVLNKDYPALLSGSRLPIHTRFDFAETGRVTSSSPNVQNWRTGAKRKNADHVEIRECFVPRPGYVFAQADYEGIELRTLAQACLDLKLGSRLAEILNAGRDPHLEVAARILNEPYDKLIQRKKDHDVYMARQTGKVANFGFPGGLGAARLCFFARKAYAVEMTEDEARDLKQAWFATLPEMRDYFRYVDSLIDPDTGLGTLTQLRSNRIRGGVNYTAACNSFFQGLAADATQAALFAISRECYSIPSSALFGCRVVNYVHDEFIVECPEHRAAEAAERLAVVMIEEANKWIPDVPAKTEPLLMRFWSKGAETIRDAGGRLQVWEGKAAA